MKRKLTFWLGIILFIMGFGFSIWGAHIYQSYPHMREMMKLASHESRPVQIIGIVLIIGGWVSLRYDL
jgi:hypothetical protein